MFNQRSNNYSNNRGSRFSSPYRGAGQRNFSRGGFTARKMRFLPNDPNLFIKKAQGSTETQYTPINSFEGFNIAKILKSNIAYKGYLSPTPIQDQAIMPILEGRDVIGLAATGTGKTAAFLIPLINKIFSDRNQKVLIIVPTRELVMQINQEFKDFAYDMKIYSAAVIGGSNIQRQIHELRRNPQVVIATPGRLKDLMERKAIYLEDFENIVLDEVDLMVDIGFINEVKYFIGFLPKVRQSLFFSATIGPKVQTILQAFVKNPVTISIPKVDAQENIDQNVIKIINPAKKIEQLMDVLNQDGFDKVMVFGRTKHGIEKLNRELEFKGFKVGAIHGNKKQSQRQRVLRDFKENQINILLATDVASRGLDIDNVTHVINYELPETYDDYIHRIGRTGRAGKTGIALTFIE
ncbi:MAG: DEAD/DEAH box helicase [Candidatus Daviesbacteria bacterium]|nr:DEAD/DEAH box helicase [Candidatus Daviesbacteria bacterium]